MDKIYGKSDIIRDCGNGFCPGCLHGVASKLIAETLDELQLKELTICVLPVGCGTLNMGNFDLDRIVSAHGRAPAVASGIKRATPDRIVFTYQGDGDLASIGIAEIIHAANRGEKFTVVFVNNCIYGMTGGQLAPTTLPNQKSSTSPQGRDVLSMGYPIKMSEIINQLDAPVFIARHALNTPKGIIDSKKSLLKAFTLQVENRGFSFVELLTNCPTNWKMSAKQSLEWMKENSIPAFKCGVIRDTNGGQ